MNSILTDTLEELENEYWGEPSYPSHLVTTLHKIRTIPLGRLTIEQLRMAIGQRMSLDYLIPLAIEKLQEEPLAAGDMYEGDLLFNLLTRVPDPYFNQNKPAAKFMCEIATQAETCLKAKCDADVDQVDINILAAIKSYLKKFQ